MAITGTLEDREQIRDSVRALRLTIDNGRYEEWIDCFTDDGVFESPRFGKHSGREGLSVHRDLQGIARRREGAPSSPIMFKLDGDNATGRCYLLYYHCKDGKVQQSTVGYLHRQAAQDAGGWRFESRQVTILGHH